MRKQAVGRVEHLCSARQLQLAAHLLQTAERSNRFSLSCRRACENFPTAHRPVSSVSRAEVPAAAMSLKAGPNLRALGSSSSEITYLGVDYVCMCLVFSVLLVCLRVLSTLCIGLLVGLQLRQAEANCLGSCQLTTLPRRAPAAGPGQTTSPHTHRGRLQGVRVRFG